MFEITYKFDTQMPVDSDELVGEITISGDPGRIIETDTLIDSWLLMLLEVIPELETEPKLTLDIEDKPDGLVIESKGDSLKLIYKDQSVSVDKKGFVKGVHDACRKFLSDVADFGLEPTDVIDLIESQTHEGS